FLRAFHRPGASWQLIAINKGKIEVEFFDESRMDAARAWIEHRNAHADIYFNINPLRPDYVARKKAGKADVAAAAYLHVDVDPPKGVDVEAWRKAILKKIAELELPKATFAVDSGRGFWLFWKLRELTTNFEEVESRNQAIAAGIGDSADHCWNID